MWQSDQWPLELQAVGGNEVSLVDGRWIHSISILRLDDALQGLRRPSATCGTSAWQLCVARVGLTQNTALVLLAEERADLVGRRGDVEYNAEKTCAWGPFGFTRPPGA